MGSETSTAARTFEFCLDTNVGEATETPSPFATDINARTQLGMRKRIQSLCQTEQHIKYDSVQRPVVKSVAPKQTTRHLY